jgi:hypothetical protein
VTFIDVLYIVIAFSLPAGVLALIVYGLYRKFRGKTWYDTGTSFMAQHIFTQYASKSSKKAVEEINYQKEDERDEAFSPEDFDPNDLQDADNEKADQ